MLHFYSRPCGRGDRYANLEKRDREKFLLTPLREGRQLRRETRVGVSEFLLTPLREGRPSSRARSSRQWYRFLLTPLREGRPEVIDE